MEIGKLFYQIKSVSTKEDSDVDIYEQEKNKMKKDKWLLIINTFTRTLKIFERPDYTLDINGSTKKFYTYK